jgi:hypothetical protein
MGAELLVGCRGKQNEAIGLEIKDLTMAGSVPGLHSYLPWWGQEEEEEAAAVIFPLGVVFAFTFISPKIGGAGEGSQVSTKKKRNESARSESCRGAEGEGDKQPGEYFFLFLLALTL